jgi:YidC/Oxa1 family membrane protein insertase
MSFFSEYKQVNKLLQEKQQVVFYAESRHYYQYFEKLISGLLSTNTKLCYITSDAADPLLTIAPANMKAIHVKWMLGFLFSKIRADVMIMTMPDLGNFLFKRSAGVGSYIYIFHAAVSTHQQYRKEAFFNYDAVFCTGEYQQKEIRKAEDLYNQRPKELISYGYPLLDQIKKDNAENSKQTILIAPSWFAGCIFETCIEELLIQLSKLPYNIILRSHPEYEKRSRKNFKKIQKLVSADANISIDNQPDVISMLSSTDILITDRSGIAFEFAFGVGKPVLFIDTALKQNNPDWQELEIEPIENKLRAELGVSVLPSQLNQIPEKIKVLENLRGGFSDRMKELKRTIFYNSNGSYKAGLDYVLKKIGKR